MTESGERSSILISLPKSLLWPIENVWSSLKGKVAEKRML